MSFISEGDTLEYGDNQLIYIRCTKEDLDISRCSGCYFIDTNCTQIVCSNTDEYFILKELE